jgi:26S proteasome regulatory subunit N1
MLDLTKKDQLMKLVEQIVPSQMKHHAEAEACDLLMEVERLDILKEFVDQVHNKICLSIIRTITCQLFPNSG